MRNNKYRLLSYELIEKAVVGESEAVNKVVRNYTGYIHYLSYFQGRLTTTYKE